MRCFALRRPSLKAVSVMELLCRATLTSIVTRSSSLKSNKRPGIGRAQLVLCDGPIDFYGNTCALDFQNCGAASAISAEI